MTVLYVTPLWLSYYKKIVAIRFVPFGCIKRCDGEPSVQLLVYRRKAGELVSQLRRLKLP